MNTMPRMITDEELPSPSVSEYFVESKSGYNMKRYFSLPTSEIFAVLLEFSTSIINSKIKYSEIHKSVFCIHYYCHEHFILRMNLAIIVTFSY